MGALKLNINFLRVISKNLDINKEKTIAFDIHSHPKNSSDDLKQQDRDYTRMLQMKCKNPNVKI